MKLLAKSGKFNFCVYLMGAIIPLHDYVKRLGSWWDLYNSDSIESNVKKLEKIFIRIKYIELVYDIFK